MVNDCQKLVQCLKTFFRQETKESRQSGNQKSIQKGARRRNAFLRVSGEKTIKTAKVATK
jgi:hypothetical protein